MDVELAENGVYESDGPAQNYQSDSQESDVEIQIRRRHLRNRLCDNPLDYRESTVSPEFKDWYVNGSRYPDL